MLLIPKEFGSDRALKYKNCSERKNLFTNLWYEHSSLFFIAIASVSYFVINIIAKKVLSTDDFNIWIYIISLITFFSTFAMMGQDQLLLRFCKSQKSSIIIDKFSITFAFSSLIIFIPLSLLLFGNNTMGVKPIEIICIIILYSFCKLAYQLTRIQKLFLLSQMSINGWKLILLPMIIFVAYIGVANLFLASFVFGAVTFLFVISSSKLKIINKIETIFKYSFGYFLSMSVMAIFVYFERFLIEGKITASEYTDFLYFLTISLSIFSILASYFGFKEAVKYKEFFSYEDIKKDLLKVLYIVIPLSIIWSLFIYFVSPLLEVRVDIDSLLLISIIGVFKCLYSILSSVMAVRMPFSDILIINIRTIVMFAIFYIFAMEFVENITFLLIIIALCWLLRSVFIFYRIRGIEGID